MASIYSEDHTVRVLWYEAFLSEACKSKMNHMTCLRRIETTQLIKYFRIMNNCILCPFSDGRSKIIGDNAIPLHWSEFIPLANDCLSVFPQPLAGSFKLTAKQKPLRISMNGIPMNILSTWAFSINTLSFKWAGMTGVNDLAKRFFTVITWCAGVFHGAVIGQPSGAILLKIQVVKPLMS